jgi:hypothetical protein
VKAGYAHGNDCAQSTPATCGLTGKCDGAGACQFYGSETVCAGEACIPRTSSYSPVSVCDGKGTCAPTSKSCGNYTCTADGVRCRVSCSSDTDCAADAYCRGTACVPKLVPGSICSRPEQCSSNLCGGRCCNPGVPCSCPQPSADNVFDNAGFDVDTSGWETGQETWSVKDADDCPFSGSLRSPAASGYPRRCVRVLGGSKYNFGMSVFINQPIVYVCQLSFNSGFNCDGTGAGGMVSLYVGPAAHVGQWNKLSVEVTADANASSAYLDCDAFDTYLDQIFLTPAPGGF